MAERIRQVFPGGQLAPLHGSPATPEEFRLALDAAIRGKYAEDRQSAWEQEIKRREEEAASQAERAEFENTFMRGMRIPQFPTAGQAEAPPTEASQAEVAVEPPVTGPPLEPLEEEIPSLASDVPVSTEEVRINPYTGQPFKTSQDTRGWRPRAVNPVTGQVMDPYENVYSEQTLLGGLVTASPAVRGPRYTGYAEGPIVNPFADSSLTPAEQTQQAIIQRTAREKAAKDRQAEAYKMFGAKWKAAQRFLSDPLTSREQKMQVYTQMQEELESFAEPSPLDTYMAAMATDSVETQVALAKKNYRDTALSLGATPEEADAVAGKVTITDGRADFSYAERHIDRLFRDHERKEERRLENEYSREKSLGKLLTQLDFANKTRSENDIAAYYALVRQHNEKWPFTGPQPDPKQGFSFAAEVKRLFPTSIEKTKTPATPNDTGVIELRTQADLERAELLLQQARERGDRTFKITVRKPNGETFTRSAF